MFFYKNMPHNNLLFMLQLLTTHDLLQSKKRNAGITLASIYMDIV